MCARGHCPVRTNLDSWILVQLVRKTSASEARWTYSRGTVVVSGANQAVSLSDGCVSQLVRTLLLCCLWTACTFMDLSPQEVNESVGQRYVLSGLIFNG
ncbi:hypothetical protein Scel_87180 [Streptomyces cellostaticus]|nr:hypothetical protein Scel_87180 [Streptomyces cellostaticus]